MNSVGGSANSTVKLSTARTINNIYFDGTSDITLYSMYAESLVGKTVSLDGYRLSDGNPKIKWYYCSTDGNGSGITGRPNDNKKKAFLLKCESIRWASTTDYVTKQTYIQGSTKTTWERYCVSGTWSAWGKTYTSQNKPTASEIGAAASNHTHSGTQVTGLTASRALVSNSSGQVAVSAVTSTELCYLDRVTSSIQAQLNAINNKLAMKIKNYVIDISRSELESVTPQNCYDIEIEDYGDPILCVIVYDVSCALI